VFLFLVNANVVPISLVLVTLMMEAIRSSEMSVLTGATRLKYHNTAFITVAALKTLNLYIALTGWTL
jgi:hypothetical protein